MIKWNLDIETASMCNRTCSGCTRNSNPNREMVADWFKPNYLPAHLVYWAVEEAADIEGFSGAVCLSHFNEPFMDYRIAEIAWSIRTLHNPKELYLHSNGDLVKEQTAHDIDGALDKIIFTLYMDDPIKTKRKEWLESLFTKTKLVFVTEPLHLPTHFSPNYPVSRMAEENIDHTCLEPSMRVVINHRRQFLLCCDDLNGNFGLGTYPEISIREHLKQKAEIQSNLETFGGRRLYPHCTTCPRA